MGTSTSTKCEPVGAGDAGFMRRIREYFKRPVPQVPSDPDHTSLSLIPEADDLKAAHPELVNDKDLPDWQPRRPFIVTGYRLKYSGWGCLASCLQLHNETINIWTHLLGAILWLRESVMFASHVSQADLPVVVAASLLGLAMFTASSVAHTFACVSPTAYQLLWRVDYAGIVLLWFGRPVFDNYLLFGLCQHQLYLSVLLLSGVVWTVLGIPVVLHKRMVCFAFLFLLTHGPMVVCWLAPEYPHPSLQGYLAVNATATLCGVLGFVIFTTRVPEVWAPGTFDIWLHSHQWWHVLTAIGPLLCWRGGYYLLEFKELTSGCVTVATRLDMLGNTTHI